MLSNASFIESAEGLSVTLINALPFATPIECKVFLKRSGKVEY